MRCKLYQIRRQLLQDLSEIFNITHLSNHEVFNLIMSVNGFDVIKCVKTFVNEAFLLRFVT